MTEAETATTEAPTIVPEVEPATGLASEVEKWKELARKNEQRAKENAQAAKRLAEIEEANKSEAQRAADAEQRAIEAELRALRLEVATEKGLSPAQAKRLVGSTRDELEADAEELLDTFKSTDEPQKPAPSGKPVERLVPGSDPVGDVALNGDPLLNVLKDRLNIP